MEIFLTFIFGIICLSASIWLISKLPKPIIIFLAITSGIGILFLSGMLSANDDDCDC
ncbi:MAG: hypothetical protein HON94_14625 [Methylococcales bacterium]|jgi:hypothetical protein|nr:hypothetical protein [Methylococcales bacterium]MBT7411395.1 hypothetical protein [Methylococcales bacterium]